MTELFEKVKLKDGRSCVIVEILKQDEAYIADIETEDGTETDFVYQKDIEE